MVDRFESFSSKILLFGEYTVILNSKALAIPYQLFGGQLSFPNDDQMNYQRNEELLGFGKTLLPACDNSIQG